MPPWPTRLLSGSPTTSDHCQTPAQKSAGLNNPESPSNNHCQQGIQRHDAPVSPFIGPPFNSHTSRSNHGRSIGHPFPLLRNKKKDTRLEDQIETHGMAVPNDQALNVVHGVSTKPTITAHRGSVHNVDTELMSGKCFTCDSSVRWPKNLSVFRCTICLMINDLRPVQNMLYVEDTNMAIYPSTARRSWETEMPCRGTPDP